MTGIGKLGVFSPRINYIPFIDFIKSPIDDIMNCVLFSPLGILLPFLYSDYACLKKIIFTGLLMSCSIEIFQMFDRGITDINDLIANIIGACIGYGIYKCLIKIIPLKWKKSFSAPLISCYCEVYFYWVLLFFVMATIQPIFIGRFFNLI